MNYPHKIRYGCCAVVFRDHSLEKAFEWIAEGGFKNVEIEANLSWCNHVDIHKDNPLAIKKMAANFGLTITALDCHRELVAPWEVKYDPVHDIQTAIQWAK